MIMFQSAGNNLVKFDSQTDVSTKSTFNQFVSYNSSTSNISEDVSIKSGQLFSLDSNIDANIDQNYNIQNHYPNYTNYDQNIEHLVSLVDKYENEIGDYDEQLYNDQTYNPSYNDEQYTSNTSYRNDQMYSQDRIYNTNDHQQSYIEKSKQMNYGKIKNKPMNKESNLHLQTVESRTLKSIKQEFDFSDPINSSTDRFANLSESNCFDFALNNTKLELNSSEFKGNLEKNDNNLNNKLEANKKSDLKLDTTSATSQQTEIEKRIPRPPNAFMIFGQQNRKLLASQFPQYTNKQISKILGDEWRKMKLEDKAHFHRLAEEAYSKHMEKYPGYYYSPLEARQRKADRKKKFFQKVNSKRSYVRRQQPSSSLTLETEDTNPVQFINFRNVIASETVNDAENQFKILKQTTDDQQNCNLLTPSPIELSSNKHITSQQISNQSNFQSSQNFNNNIDLKLKFESQANQNNQINAVQQQPNCLFYSQNLQSNNDNSVYNMFNNQNASNYSKTSLDLSQNNAPPFTNHNQSNGSIYHFHHPTIYHVTTKDPNLNSTLNSTITDTTISNGCNFNGNMTINNDLPNSSLNNLNYNKNLTDGNNYCNSANQFILTNQLLLQRQQFYNHHLIHQQNDGNTLSLYVPRIEPNNSIQQQYIKVPVGKQQFSLNNIMTDTERQQNNCIITHDAIKLTDEQVILSKLMG